MGGKTSKAPPFCYDAARAILKSEHVEQKSADYIQNAMARILFDKAEVFPEGGLPAKHRPFTQQQSMRINMCLEEFKASMKRRSSSSMPITARGKRKDANTDLISVFGCVDTPVPLVKATAAQLLMMYEWEHLRDYVYLHIMVYHFDRATAEELEEFSKCVKLIPTEEHLL